MADCNLFSRITNLIWVLLFLDRILMYLVQNQLQPVFTHTKSRNAINGNESARNDVISGRTSQENGFPAWNDIMSQRLNLTNF